MTTVSTCKALTLAGKKCKNKAKQDGYCLRHIKIAKEQSNNNAVITMTYCECSENHVGMEKNGAMAEEGFTLEELKGAQATATKKGLKSDLYELHTLITEPKDNEKAWVLVIRGGIDYILGRHNVTQKEGYEKLITLIWDDKYYDVRRGRVLNKHARTNMCVGDVSQKANFEEKKGTIYAFKDVAVLKWIREFIPDFLGDKGKNMLAEGNCYRDGGLKKNGIGYHGDSERRCVVGFRFGAQEETPSLYYRWYGRSFRPGLGGRYGRNDRPDTKERYEKSNVISKTLEVPLRTGDMYIMSHKAVGTDWKRRIIRTLRHSTGAPKYTK